MNDTTADHEIACATCNITITVPSAITDGVCYACSDFEDFDAYRDSFGAGGSRGRKVGAR